MRHTKVWLAAKAAYRGFNRALNVMFLIVVLVEALLWITGSLQAHHPMGPTEFNRVLDHLVERLAAHCFGVRAG
jgi:hypothetical protein